MKPRKITCSGCGTKTTVPEHTQLLKEKLCRKCYDEWNELDRKANEVLRNDRKGRN